MSSGQECTRILITNTLSMHYFRLSWLVDSGGCKLNQKLNYNFLISLEFRQPYICVVL